MKSFGQHWPLDRYSAKVARTTTREAMTQGTINRLREYGITLAQVSAHSAQDFCIYYENAVVTISDKPSYRPAGKPHPVYPPISAINGGPPFHLSCVHLLTPFVEQLATETERKREIISPEVLSRTPGGLQRRYRKEFVGGAGTTK